MLRGREFVDMLCEKAGMLGKLSIGFLIWKYSFLELYSMWKSNLCK